MNTFIGCGPFGRYTFSFVTDEDFLAGVARGWGVFGPAPGAVIASEPAVPGAELPCRVTQHGVFLGHVELGHATRPVNNFLATGELHDDPAEVAAL